eukprot:2575437-Amphidinium_carterae.1
MVNRGVAFPEAWQHCRLRRRAMLRQTDFDLLRLETSLILEQKNAASWEPHRDVKGIQLEWYQAAVKLKIQNSLRFRRRVWPVSSHGLIEKVGACGGVVSWAPVPSEPQERRRPTAIQIIVTAFNGLALLLAGCSEHKCAVS